MGCSLTRQTANPSWMAGGRKLRGVGRQHSGPVWWESIRQSRLQAGEEVDLVLVDAPQSIRRRLKTQATESRVCPNADVTSPMPKRDAFVFFAGNRARGAEGCAAVFQEWQAIAAPSTSRPVVKWHTVHWLPSNRRRHGKCPDAWSTRDIPAMNFRSKGQKILFWATSSMHSRRSPKMQNPEVTAISTSTDWAGATRKKQLMTPQARCARKF